MITDVFASSNAPVCAFVLVLYHVEYTLKEVETYDGQFGDDGAGGIRGEGVVCR